MRIVETILAALSVCVTPAEATRAALADVQSLDPQYRGQMRFVVCEDREQEIAVRYLVNAVGRSRRIVKPERVRGERLGVRNEGAPHVHYPSPITSYPSLLRIDLATLADGRDARTYHAIHAAWERLAADDPYFHVKTQIVVGGQWPVDSGQKRPLSTDHRPPTTVVVDGGWVGLDAAAALRAATASAGPVLRADYFISHVAAEDYYAWAGVPEKQADLFQALGVDKTAIERLAADTAANLLKSNVTYKPRRVVRLPSPQGAVWITLDVDGESPDRDPLRNPVDVIPVAKAEGGMRKAENGPSAFRVPSSALPPQRFNYQGSEIFFTRANGFWGTALYNAAGQRQASVPDRIAKDSHSPDGIVQPLISCIRCHETQGHAGLQPFNDDQYPLLSGEAAIAKSFLPEVALRLGELYDPARQNKHQARDREDYSAAVRAACGCSTDDAAAALSQAFARFVHQDVTRDTASAECGVSSAEFVARTAGSTDPITLSLRAGRRVTRKNFEASFQDIMLRVTRTN